MTNCTVLEQAHSRQIPVSPCRNLFGQDQVCGNNLKGLGGVTSLVKRAERRWGYNEVARQHLLLVRMCLKALPCFHAPSFSNALCDYSWSHSDAVKKAVRICAGVQSTKATRPDIFKTHRYGVGLYRGPLIKIFVFIPHRTAELRWSFSAPLHGTCNSSKFLLLWGKGALGHLSVWMLSADLDDAALPTDMLYYRKGTRGS